MSVKRYQHVQETSDDPRAVEHRALSRVTGMLVTGADQGGAALAEACHMNRMLWTIFQSDLALPGTMAHYAHTLSLPLFPAMADGDVDRIAAALEQALS